MPLIFADANIFSLGKSIPCLPSDVIGIEVTASESFKLKQMDESTTKRHFTNFFPEKYIIFTSNKNPRYSSFRCKVSTGKNDFEPIELTPKIQNTLFRMVELLKEEWSGVLKNSGLSNLKEGSSVNAPIQPDRTHDAIPFHTHPVLTYKKFKVNYGLPSVADLKNLHSKPLPPNVSNAHLLLSREGIYVIAKKTCESVPKVHLSDKQFKQILTDCSFILLPWNFAQSWFIF